MEWATKVSACLLNHLFINIWTSLYWYELICSTIWLRVFLYYRLFKSNNLIKQQYIIKFRGYKIIGLIVQILMVYYNFWIVFLWFQTERSFQRQPTIFLNRKKGLGAKKRKSLRYTRNIGLGFKTPREVRVLTLY